MAKGKLKYRDVVGGGRGKAKKGKQGRGNSKKPHKPRKTYSLYKNDNQGTKRKRFNQNDTLPEPKQAKIEKEPELQESSSEYEDEEEDALKQLQQTFGGVNNKKSLAIDSSEESDVEEEETEDEHVEDEYVDDEDLEEEEVDDEGVEEEEVDDEILEEEDHDSVKEGEAQDVEEEESDFVEEEEDIDEEELNTKDNEEDKTQNEEDETDNAKDPFVRHLFYDLHEKLVSKLQQPKVIMINSNEKWPKLGNLLIQIPECDKISEPEVNQFSIEEKQIYAPLGEKPVLIKNEKPADLFIKSQIIPQLQKSNKCLLPNSKHVFTGLQKEIFSVVNNYQDFYFSERNFDNAEEIRYVYCLHAINHVLKTRLKVIHHNARLSKKADVPDEFRDQGLVRPKVLIILPFKDSAYKVINNIMEILLPVDKGNVMNKLRFIEDYTGNELIMPKKNPKPEDYERTFAGNTSDDFKIGITVTKKSLKLYADFYSSDIIVASPLGLRTIIGAEGEPDRDYDFLASIEVLIFDQMELFLMQNWDHVVHIMNHIHMQPKNSHGTDFSRVRSWSLNGWAKYYRQTLIFSSTVLPEINSIFNKKCLNYAGKVKTANNIEFGSISQVFVQLPHVFHRFDSANAATSIEDRFDFFINKILPQQRDTLMKQTLIFVPNYFDYVRLRNYFKREDIGFTQICEYSKENKIARARDMFFHGDAHFMLYTERYHFFNRIRVKGIRHIVFYQLPMFPHFYYEICNLMQEGNMNRKVGSSSNMTVNVIYSKYDVHQLSSIVGTVRAAKMVQSDRKVHMLLT